jgi:ketosteroid isomerase-like protein
MTKLKLAGAALAVLAAASLFACNKPAVEKPDADTSKIADAVKADADQLVADFNAHDAVKSASHDAPGMVGMFHGTPNTVGADADLANTKQLFADSPATKFTVADESVDVAASGDMAVYRSTYAYSYNDPKTKKPITESGNWLTGYRKQPDGSWKMVWEVLSDTPPAPATAPGAKS